MRNGRAQSALSRCPGNSGRRSGALDRLLGRPLASLGLHPNHVTALGLLLLAGVVYHFLRGEYWAATGYMALSGLCDLADGSLARFSGRCSRLGQLFDRTADKIVDTTILSLIAGLGLVPLPLALFVIGATLTATVVSANIEAIFRQPVSDALSLRAPRYLLLLLFTPLELFGLLFVLLAAISGIGLLWRLRAAYRLSLA